MADFVPSLLTTLLNGGYILQNMPSCSSEARPNGMAQSSTTIELRSIPQTGPRASDSHTTSSANWPLRASQEFWGLEPYIPPSIGVPERSTTPASATKGGEGESSHPAASRDAYPQLAAERDDALRSNQAENIGTAATTSRSPSRTEPFATVTEVEPMPLQDVTDELRTKPAKRSCWEQVKQKFGAKK